MLRLQMVHPWFDSDAFGDHQAQWEPWRWEEEVIAFL